MQSKLETYKRRYVRAQGVAYQWWALLQACYHYFTPQRNLYYQTNQTQAAQRNVRVYDTTQIAAGRNFVSKLQNSLCPPQMTWALLEPGSEIPEEYKTEFQQELDKFNERLFSYIRSSNFDLAINECFQDLITGTAVLVCNAGTSDDKPLIFGSIPLAQVSIEESVSNRAESCYRTWQEVKVSDIELMWPNAVIPSELLELYKQDPTATVKNVIEAVVHNPRDALPYNYCVWWENNMLLDEKEATSPLIIFRTSKLNNEVFGRGVGMDALPSVMSLQTAFYFEMTAANLNICKPYMAYSDGVFNPWTFNMQPNTVIPVSPTTNGQFPIQPMPDVANPAFMQITTADLRMQINKLMYADPLGPMETTPRTAFELSIRQRNLAEEIGPMFTRLQQEFMEPVINRIIYILQARGLLPKLVIDGKVVTARYKSPLTQSQGQQDVDTFLRYQQTMQAIVGAESAIVYLKPEQIGVWTAEKMGVDSTLINSKEDMKALFDQQNEEAQQEKEMMMQMEAQNAA